MKMIAAVLTLAGIALGQQPSGEQPRQYARAIYTRWKPDKAAEGQAFIKGTPYKASQGWVKGDPSAVGQVTMTRVLPGGIEVAHDRLRLLITTTPPDLTPGAGLAAIAPYVDGMTPAEYNAKLNSFMDGIRTEVWRSVFRHGSIQVGDFVRVQRYRVPTPKRTTVDNLYRDWEGGMRAQLVKDQVVRGAEGWTVRMGADTDPYFVILTARADSASIQQGFGNQEQIFHKAYPGRDYHIYRAAEDAVLQARESVESIVYRVDFAVWK